MVTAVATTELPDAQQPTLDASTEDEITVNWTDVIDNGDYRIQYYDTGDDFTGGNLPAWTDDGTEPESATSHAITGLEDGEEYGVRIRTETEHVTGSYTSEVNAVTVLPAPSSVTATVVSDTEVDVSWVDESDNEDGFLVFRSQDIDGMWSDERELADLAAGSTSYTDTTAQPNRTYRYRIEVYTEHTTSSDSVTTTTTGPGLETKRAPPDGWYAEVDLPNGESVELDVSSDAIFIPILNDLPRCRLPVQRTDRWESGDIDGQPLRVWQDGYRLPIDEVRNTTRQASRDVVHGIGGLELDQYVDGIEFIEEEAHLAAEQVIQNQTAYTANVDDPATNTRDDVLFKELNSSSEWDTIAADNPNLPIEKFGDTLRTTEAGWFEEAENLGGSEDQTLIDSGDGNWSNDEVSVLNSGAHHKSFTFTPDYDILGGELHFGIHFANPDGNPPFTMSINDEEEGVLEDALTTTSDFSDMRWFDMTATASFNAGESITVRFELDGSGGDIYLDALYAWDDRWPPTRPNGATNTVMQGCREYPDGVEVVLDEIASVELISAGRIDSDFDSTANGQAVAVTNDGGLTWHEATNSETVDATFASSSTSIQSRFTFGNTTEDPNTSPGVGDAGQTISLFQLYADLEDTPLVIDKSWKGKVKTVLNRIREAGEFAWEVRRDGGTYSVEWSQVGHRTTDRELGFVQFSGDHTIEQTYERVIVTGASKRVLDERFTFTSGVTAIGLDESLIIPGSETVYDPQDESVVLERRTDYNMRWQEGAIEIIDSGNLQEDKEYAIDYQWKVQGEYALPDVSNPRTTEVPLPQARTQLECEQLALGLVKRLQEPLDEATATIAEVDPRWSLIEALSSPGIPFDGPLEVREFDAGPPPMDVRLGSRKSFGEEVDELRSRLDAISELV